MTDDDRRLWAKWKRICLMHSNTSGYKRRVSNSRGYIQKMYELRPNAYVAWSAGKDSTAMAHIIAGLTPGVRAMSIKDDCDYPGEVEYIKRLAEEWGLDIEIVRPRFALQKLLGNASPGENLHSRSCEFSRIGFYSLVDEYRERNHRPGVYLGLRKRESSARRIHLSSRGAIYTKADGETVCSPLCDWSDIDVYSYLFSNKIEPFHVYRCVRLTSTPAEIRKSWWVPGSAARHGQMVWLRTYYPSLFNKVCNLLPEARCLA